MLCEKANSLRYVAAINLGLLFSPRSWLLLASLVTRGAGFVTSFILARALGPYALGEYSGFVNTASSAMQPLLQVVGNNSTLLAAEAHREVGSVSKVASANVLLVGVLSIISFVVFMSLHSLVFSAGPTAYASRLGVIAAGIFIVGQLCGAVLQGCHYGAGRFMTAARVSIGISLLTVVVAVPAVLLWGLEGAYVVLAVGSVALPFGLASSIASADQIIVADRHALKRAIGQFKLSLPSVARGGAGAIVYWLCTVYFVRRSFGVEGVGLVAVAMQWLTVMVLAVASWGGFSIKILAEAVSSGDPLMVRQAVFRLVKQNIVITLPVAGLMFFGANWIEQAYGLRNSGMDLLIRLNAVCALFLACNAVVEQLLLCLNRQKSWFLFSASGFLVQLFITAALIEKGLYMVSVGFLAGSVVPLCACALSLDKMLGSMHRR